MRSIDSQLVFRLVSYTSYPQWCNNRVLSVLVLTWGHLVAFLKSFNIDNLLAVLNTNFILIFYNSG